MDMANWEAAARTEPHARGGGAWGKALAALQALRFLLDRTFALFLGIGVGAMIALSFLEHGQGPTPRAARPAPAAVKPAEPARPSPTAADAAVPFQPHLLEAIASGRPVTVGVFGDSFGDGVYTALYRRLPKAGSYKVLKFSEPATGFVRNPDLGAGLDARLAGQQVDIAVIDFGANDTQGLVDGGKPYALFSPGWRAAYGRRVDALVAGLRAKGAMVFWLGLPKMRSETYDAHVAEMNAFYAERMAALGVPYLSVTDLTADGTGQFNAYLPDGPRGEARLMRAGDGIHMSMAGYERISAPLADRIQAYVARAAVAARLRPQIANAEPANAGPAKDAGQ